MKQKIERGLLNILSERMARHATASVLMPKYNLHKSVKLDESEIAQIHNIWNPVSSKIDFRYWEVYKGMFQFSPLLVPDDIYVRNMVRVLDPMRKSYCLQNKNMYPILYKDLRMPVTLINCMDGQVYDPDHRQVSNSDIIKILKKKSENPKLILKPSADSCGGNGVRILDLQDEKSCADMLREVGDNFVIQEILSQSEVTKRFNPSSLNTFRINTLNLNGEISVENIMFRHGRGDSIVDNAGAGGVCVGFDPDGTIVGKAIDAKLNIYTETLFGKNYGELHIPELTSVCETAIAAHREYLPMMGHVAWDFALNEKNEPVFIEVNLGWPGIMTEQLSSCRPVFGNRTAEVIEYVKNNHSKMSFTDFTGHWT